MSPILFMDRSRKADRYPWLEWKVRLFAVGAGLAVAGMAMDTRWLVAVAIVILFAGFLIRFLPGGTGESSEERDPMLDETR